MSPSANGPFALLDEHALRALVPRGMVRSFPRHTVIMSEGDETDALYVLLSGRVKAFVADDAGREVVVNTIGAGDYFGELILDGGPRAASVMTLAPSRLFVIPRRDVEQLLRANPAFAQDLIGKLIGKVRRLTAQVRDLALKDVYSRFLQFVNANAIEAEGGRVVPERLTQHEIAARIGGSREMVSRIVSDLSAGGYIAVEAKHIRILNKLPQRW